MASVCPVRMMNFPASHNAEFYVSLHLVVMFNDYNMPQADTMLQEGIWNHDIHSPVHKLVNHSPLKYFSPMGEKKLEIATI